MSIKNLLQLMTISALIACTMVAKSHRAHDIKVQVLGSGGPNDIDGRASTAYLIWENDAAKIMIDVGSGSALRYGQSGGDIRDLELLAVTHLHVDHVGDMATLFKRAYFADRSNKPALLISGPSGNQQFPDIQDYMLRLFDKSQGAYRYLSDAMPYQVKQFNVSLSGSESQEVVKLSRGNMTVSTLSIGHADVPSLAYRIDTPAGKIAFSSDNNGRNEHFISFIKNVDILVMHLPDNEQSEESGYPYWHANPTTIGQLAAKANVKKLVLSHFMDLSLNDLPASLALVKKYYSGPVVLAEDLMVIPVKKKPLF